MNGTFPKLWPNVWLTACSALALAVGGCGGDEGRPGTTPGEPRIRASEEDLAVYAERVAGFLEVGDVCGAVPWAIHLLNGATTQSEAGNVPAELAPELSSSPCDLRLKTGALAMKAECPPMYGNTATPERFVPEASGKPVPLAERRSVAERARKLEDWIREKSESP